MQRAAGYSPGRRQSFLLDHPLLELLRGHPDDIFVLVRVEVISFGIQILQQDASGRNILLPRMLCRLSVMELQHHFPGEQIEAFADIPVAGPSSLVQRDYLIDMRRLELAQALADGFR